MAARTPRRVRTLPPDSHHGFFKTLPRELRDKLYDMSYERFFHRRSSRGSPLVNVSIPCVALRLVSRQAKLEFDERVAKTGHLTTLEIPAQHHFPSSSLGGCTLYSQTTNLTIDWWSCYGGHSRPEYLCDTAERLDLRARWLDDVASDLPNLRRIRVSLLVTYEQCMDAVMESLDSITNKSMVIEVRIRHTGFGAGGYWSLIKSEMLTFATWTKQHGLAWDHKAIERSRESGRLRRAGTS